MKINYKNIILLTLILFVFSSCKVKVANRNIDKGIFEIQNVSDDSLYSLNGNWEFYYQNFIAPDKFKNYSTDTVQYQKVPDDWTNYKINGKTINKFGNGTYHLRIIAPKGNVYALKMNRIYTAYKLWVNDTLLMSLGTLGNDEKTSTANARPVIVSFNATSDTNDVVIHVSHYHYAKAGLTEECFLGNPETIYKVQENEIMLAFVIFGAYILIGISFLITAIAARRGRILNLSFSLIIIFNILYQLLNKQGYFLYYVPNINFELMTTLCVLSHYLQLLFIIIFTYLLFKKENPFFKPIIYSSGAITLFLIMLVIFAEMKYFDQINSIFAVTYIITNAYFLIKIPILAIKGNRKAKTLAVGYGIYMVALTNELLNVFDVIDSVSFMEFGKAAIILTNAVVLLAVNTFYERDSYKSKLLNSDKVDEIKKYFYELSSFDLLGMVKILSKELEIGTICVYTSAKKGLNCDVLYENGIEKISYLREPIKYKLDTSFFDVFDDNSEDIIIKDNYLIARLNDKTGSRKFVYFENIKDVELLKGALVVLQYEISLFVENYIIYNKERNLSINFDDILEKSTTKLKDQQDEIIEQEEKLNVKYDEIEKTKKEVDKLNQISLTKNIELEKNIELIQKYNDDILVQKEKLDKNINAVRDNLRYSKAVHEALIGVIEKNIDVDYFKFSCPKRIISGDFFFAKKTGDNLLFLLLDIHYTDTIALFFTSYLYSILEDVSNSGQQKIFEHLDIFIKKVKINYFNTFGKNNEVRDFSFFIGVLKNNGELTYCAEDIFVHSINKDNITVLSKPGKDKITVNIDTIEQKNYPVKKHTLNNKDRLYLQTDGFCNQPRKSDGEMFGYTRMEQMLTNLVKYELSENAGIVEKIYLEWKKENKQIDDYLILGYDFKL